VVIAQVTDVVDTAVSRGDLSAAAYVDLLRRWPCVSPRLPGDPAHNCVISDCHCRRFPWAVCLSASKANLSRLRRYVPSALASLGAEPGLAHGVLTLLANLALEKRNQVPLMTVVPTLLGVFGESPPPSSLRCPLS
jgi:hypothetical protein